MSPSDTAPVRVSPGVLHTERTARKRYRCGWECGAPIEPGTRYVRSALPPWTFPNESGHWWYQALHGHFSDGCPVYQPELPRDPIAAELALR